MEEKNAKTRPRLTFINCIDAEELNRIANRIDYRHTKRLFIKEGYTNPMCLYGVIKNEETGEVRRIRIDLLFNRPYTKKLIQSLYEWFYIHPPNTCYSIWIYDGKKKGLGCVGRYDI